MFPPAEKQSDESNNHSWAKIPRTKKGHIGGAQIDERHGWGSVRLLLLVVAVATIIEVFPGCFGFGSSNQSKIETLVESTIKDRLFAKGTKIKSVKILKDLALNDPKIADLSLQHIWFIQVVADETNSFSNQRLKVVNCLGLSSDNDVENFRIVSIDKCDENPSADFLAKIDNEITKVKATLLDKGNLAVSVAPASVPQPDPNLTNYFKEKLGKNDIEAFCKTEAISEKGIYRPGYSECISHSKDPNFSFDPEDFKKKIGDAVQSWATSKEKIDQAMHFFNAEVTE